MHSTNIVASQPGGHGLNALACALEQQASAIVLQRDVSIGMPCGSRQALDICRKASFLFFYNTVALAAAPVQKIEQSVARKAGFGREGSL
jgi:hypothetical protein